MDSGLNLILNNMEKELAVLLKSSDFTLKIMKKFKYKGQVEGVKEIRMRVMAMINIVAEIKGFHIKVVDAGRGEITPDQGKKIAMEQIGWCKGCKKNKECFTSPEPCNKKNEDIEEILKMRADLLNRE